MNRIISLFLFIFIASCLNAQYNTPIKNKVTLGKQTTADGLVYRGVEDDTALITPFSDTSAYIILDTVNNKFYNYNRTTNVWSLAGGSDTSLIAYVNTYGTQTVNGVKTFNDRIISTNAMHFVDTALSIVSFAKKTVQPNGMVGVGSGVLSTKTDYTTGTNPLSVAVDPTGRFLYVANFGSNTVSQYFLQSFSAGGYNVTGSLGIKTDAPTEELHVVGNARITGNISVGSATPTTSGTGITFPATQSASTNVNTLDDYEEGTWTPTIKGSTIAGTYTPSTTNAYYTKIGNKVTVWCFVDMRSGTATGGTGLLVLESLPFSYKAGSDFSGTTRFDFVDYPQASSHGTFAGATTGSAAANIIFQISRDNASTESISITGFTTSSLLTTNFSYTTN